MSKKIKKFVPNRNSGRGGHLVATSKLFCGKTLYLLLILFLSIALFAGLIFTVGGGSNGFLSNKPQDVSNAASSTPRDTSGTWITDGRQASGFAGGSGTADDPYQIATAAQLAYLSYMIYNDLAPVQKVTETDTDSDGYVTETRNFYYNYLDTYFELIATIDLSNYYWQPIGRYQNLGSSDVPSYHYRAFSGHFDGNNFSVIGVHTKDAMCQGLFGIVGVADSHADATISNVHVAGNILGSYQTAAVVGRAMNVAITYCSTSASVQGSGNYIGGIVGLCDNLIIKDCWNLGVITSSNNCVGGIVGGDGDGITTITNCYNKAEIKGRRYVAGIIGHNIHNSTISQCYNSGYINTASGDSSSGGIVGCFSEGVASNSSDHTISQCYNSGQVGNSSSNYIGGIVGYAALISGATITISDCYNIGTVTGDDSVGGITGEFRQWDGAHVTIRRCYNAASIKASSNAGGISGLFYKSGLNNDTYIQHCISIGTVTGSPRGALVGDKSGGILFSASIKYSNNRYSQDISAGEGSSTSNCIYVSTLADDIKSQDYFATNFSTWDFDSVWTFIEGENNGYPVFQYQAQQYSIHFNAAGGNVNYADVFAIDASAAYANGNYTYTYGGLNFTYDLDTHILTINGTATAAASFPSSQNMKLRAGDKYDVLRQYISGSTSGSSDCLVIEVVKNWAQLSTRNHTDYGFISSGSAVNTIEISELAEAEGDALKGWYWFNGVTRTFSNYKIKYQVVKQNDTAWMKTFVVDDTVGGVSTPFRNGYIFTGYYSQPNGEGTQYFDETGACVLQPKDDIVLYAAWEDNTWLGHAADSFAGGSGSQSSPYLIETAEQLALLTYNVYNGVGAQDEYAYVDTYFKQIADIDLSTYPWVPIGVHYNLDGVLTNFNFAGNFDGGGYTISGIELVEVTGEAYNRRGLFGIVNGEIGGGEIKNINITNSNITGGSYIGGLVGYAGTDAIITNCSVDATITGTGNCIGGIVGGGEGTSVTNCEAYGSVTGVHYTGGIMGNGMADISGCSNYAIVKGNERVGGMIGNGFNCSVSGCFNFEKISGSGGVGGIVGLADNMDIVNGYNLGMVNTTASYAGGIAGRITNNTTIKFGVNTGKITSDNFVGGIAGDTITGSTITQSLNLGDIVSSNNNAGGILGCASNANVSTITNCYSNCNISASSCGALVGGTNAVTISYCAGISNTGSGFYASTSQSGVTNSYVVCNGVLTLSQTTSGMDGNFGYNASFHGGLPIPHGIYAITEFFTQTGIQSYLQNKF